MKKFGKFMLTLALSTVLVLSNLTQIWAITWTVDMESTYDTERDNEYKAWIGAWFKAHIYRSSGLDNSGGKLILSYESTSRYMALYLDDAKEIINEFNVHSSGRSMCTSLSAGSGGISVSTTSNSKCNDATFILHKYWDWEAYQKRTNVSVYNVYTWDDVDFTVTTTVINKSDNLYSITNSVGLYEKN